MSSRYEQWDIVSSVGLTALLVAAGRAVDTHRTDGLVDDPYAEAFVAAADPPRPLPTRPDQATGDPMVDSWQMMSGYMGLRSRYFDEYFTDAGGDGVDQAVILAAGLDTRAHRRDWAPGTVLYEVDQPDVLAFKDEVLAEQGAAPRCERRVVAVDLREDWTGALEAAGFDPARPTAWLAEGLLPYLPAAAEESLLTAVTARSAPGSRIALEDFTGVASEATGRRDTVARQLDDPEFRRIAEHLGVDMADLVHSDERPAPGDVLAAAGWTVHAAQVAELSRRWGRELDPMAQRVNAWCRLLTARLATPG